MLLQFRDLGVTSWPFVDHSFTFVSDKWGPCPAGQIIREQNNLKSTIPS